MCQQEGYIGRQIGEYRLVSKLGGGGFGTVYLAEHVHDHTQAAVKVLNISLTKHEDLRNFLNEASTIRLRHPHIVPLLNFGISRDDLPFLVMEYAPQGTLRDRYPKGERIPLPAIVSYVNQIASALQYAHEHYVIHQDVKPENILARADRTLMISDFGIAKILEQSVLMSQQKVAGTPVYMAPEQHRGYPCFASDQYALAVMVYEWICGVRPFQGTAIGLAAQHMNTPPSSLRNYLPELPEAVEHVVFKALAKAPEDRFESIQIFADALHSAMQPIVASSTIKTNNTAVAAHAEPTSLLDRQASSHTGEKLVKEPQETTNYAASQTIAPALTPSQVPYIQNDQDLSQDRRNSHSQDDTPLLAASNGISIHVEPKKPMIRVNRAPITKRLLSLMAMVLGGSVALSIIMPYLVDAIKFTPPPPVIQSSILPTSTSKAIQTSPAQITTSTPTVVQVSLTQFSTSTPIVAQVSPTQVPTSTPTVAPASPTPAPTPSPHATDSAAPSYRPSGSYTKWWATTFGTAPGYMGSRQVGVLYANKNYMFCKAWGGMVTDSSGNYNHWWLWTDLDNHGGQGWVSAYYLKNWGNDEAKDDSGHVIPNC